jgi:hypothetical protein
MREIVITLSNKISATKLIRMYSWLIVVEFNIISVGVKLQTNEPPCVAFDATEIFETLL